MMVFTGRTEEDNKPSKHMKNSINRSQIFYAERPDSWADKSLSSAQKGYNKRNNSSIGRMDIPDSFELSIVSRGRNQLSKMQNHHRTTMYDAPVSKTLKKVYSRSPADGRNVPAALRDSGLGSLLKDQFNPKSENVERDFTPTRRKPCTDKYSQGVVNGLNFAQMDPKKEEKTSMRSVRMPKEMLI